MRVNEVISRCRTDQKVAIHYEGRYIVGSSYEIIASEEYRNTRIGDMFVTKIGIGDYRGTRALYLKAVKA